MAAKRYNIALLVANITDPFSNAVTRGAVSAAARLDADLTIFPGKYIGIQDKYDLYDTTYEYQHNVLFDYASHGGFDYIIAAVGTIAYALDNEGKKAFLDKFGNAPVLSLAADIEGYDSLEFDNSSVMYEIVDELVSQGRRNIGIMAGNLNNCECEERFIAFKDALGRHGIALKSSNVMLCDISEYCVSEANHLIERVPDLDAVVCINDKIAAVMCEQLKKHGKTVGRDVAVVGFDDLPGSAELDPPLATVRADAESLGARAVEKVIHKLNGIEDNDKYFPTSFIRRSSCSRDGCPKGGYKKLSENERDKLKQAASDRIHIDNIFIRDTMMIGRNIQTSYIELLKRLSMIGSSTAFIYTSEQPFTLMPGGKLPGDISWRFRSYCYGSSAYSPPKEEQQISFREVFDNKYLCTNRQHCFIASALFAADIQYGLALLEPASFDFFDELELVCYILSSGVRTISILNEHEQLLNKLKLANLALEKESKIDSLTGIYNRRG
ncbi:MAG: substrate-binding domain-containing protein, partial [Ruminococcus sp.]|nr:substrate-binding domain-containing protein [Ruminococcus sp.]